MGDQSVEPNASSEETQAPDPEALRAQLAMARHELRRSEARRLEAREREALLRGELQHRVRNVLATVRSIFSRTVAAGGSLEDVADHFRGRLDAIARYQSAQASQPGVAADLEQMVRDELHSFQFGDDPKIDIAGPRVSLGGEAAQMIGLALHELVTNAIKFGALSTDDGDGRLRIRWSVRDGLLRLEWRETGVAVLAVAPVRRGFGRELIEQALPYQLGAMTSFDLRPGGVRCTIALRPDTLRSGRFGET